MPKPFRVNFTPNHRLVLEIVARLNNATAQAVAHAIGTSERKYWRGYLNDLARCNYVTCKTIYSTALHGKSGRKVGTLYALTEHGAAILQEETGNENGFYYPEKGITANSPFQFPHRSTFLELMADFLRLEKTSPRQTLPNGDEIPHIEILEMTPYFRIEGTNRFGTGKPLVSVTIPRLEPDQKPQNIIPDAILRIRIGEKIRLIAVEMHRDTDTKKIIKQLEQHTKAMEYGLFSTKYQHPTANFLFSIHQNEDRLKQVIQRIRNGEIERFERYKDGVMFATLESVLQEGIENSLYHLDGKKSHLF
jgi:hypothetical protein